MDSFSEVYKSFNFEKMPIESLIKISSLVDARKDPHKNNDTEQTVLSAADKIISLQNNKNTFSIGNKIYEELNKLIVEKNTKQFERKNGDNFSLPDKIQKNSGVYKIIKTTAGYKFVLVSNIGEVLSTSEVYSTLESCINGIKSLQKHGHADIEDQSSENYNNIVNPKYEMYVDKEGLFRFRLKASNGLILSTSKGYFKKDECLGAIQKMRESVNTNDVEKG
ncbi:MAG: YegP family protein [Oscillospiraceae bacterium]|nr:YegP family protein [Oscillospiraceae bacterium]